MLPLSQSFIKRNLGEFGHIKLKPFHHIIIGVDQPPDRMADRMMNKQTINRKGW